MSRIVRLEGLSPAVNPRDIRLHFSGRKILQGGVTIIGGEHGIAYLDFTTLSDARSAIRLSGTFIKDALVYVYPSSISEMEWSLRNESSFSTRNGIYEERNEERLDSVSHRTHLYLRVRGGSAISNIESVRRYFDGLDVVDIINTSNNSAIKRGDALVKFASNADAYEGKRRYRDRKEVTVMWSNEREWEKHLRQGAMRNERRGHHSRSPHKKSRSPQRRIRSPENQSNEHEPIDDEDCCVHVANLNFATRKEDLKKFFNVVSDDDITFLCDKKGHRAKECFVVFKTKRDYRRILKRDQVKCKGALLFISPISKSSMKSFLTGRKALFSRYRKKGKCLYLRNFPSNVTKSDIQKFFNGFSLKKEDISLLCDKNGVGLGEVFVAFSSEEDWERAEKMHRKRFEDNEIPVRLIPKERLHNFLCANSVSLTTDPYDCVTQEDDLLDEDSDQENDTSDEDDKDDYLPDSDFHQTDNAHECVTQEDDASDNSAVHEDEVPSTSGISNENSIHVDNGDDIPVGEASSSEGLGQ